MGGGLNRPGRMLGEPKRDTVSSPNSLSLAFSELTSSEQSPKTRPNLTFLTSFAVSYDPFFMYQLDKLRLAIVYFSL